MIESVQEAIIIKKKILIIPLILLLVWAIIVLKPKYYERTIYHAFNTVSRLGIYSKSDTTEKYEKMLYDISQKLDVYSDSSLIARLNNGEKVDLTPDITKMLIEAKNYSVLLSDYFDITINPLVEIWTSAEDTLPSNISEKLALIGAENLVISEDANTAVLTSSGSSVTLAAVAKGYAADVIVNEMKKDGISSALVNLGGNVYVLGNKLNGTPWSVAIANPKDAATPLLSVSVSNKAVVTSGDYERYFEIGGKKYNHIINPKTGYPVSTDIHSVTVIGNNAMLCDILSTAIFTAGKDIGKQIAENFNVDIILTDDKYVYHTSGLAKEITLYDTEYILFEL